MHPGGPYWAAKDDGVWSLPKGEYDDREEPLDAARREFSEETGFVATGPFESMGSVRTASGKTIIAWAFRGDFDPRGLRSNTFRMEWPPRSGAQQDFPEIDRGAWYSLPDARRKLAEAQHPFLDALERHPGVSG